MRKNSWTAKEDNFIIKQYYILGPINTSKQLNRTLSAIKSRASKLGIKCNRWWSEEEKEYIKNHYGKVHSDILAQRFNVSRPAIIDLAKKMKISHSMWWSDQEDIVLREKINQLPAKDIAKLLRRTKAAVEGRIHLLGLYSTYHPRKYSHNADFFTNPNLLNSYWAGFIAADGYINKRLDGVEITLQTQDKSHLNKFKQDIQFSGKIINGRINEVRLRISGARKIVDDLKKNFNITNKKSLTLEPPKNLNLTQSLAYIKGYIDGDGHISERLVYNKKYLTFGMIGTENSLLWIKNIFDLLFPKSRNGLANLVQIKICPKLQQYNISGKRAEVILQYLKTIITPELPRKWKFIK